MKKMLFVVITLSGNGITKLKMKRKPLIRLDKVLGSSKPQSRIFYSSDSWRARLLFSGAKFCVLNQVILLNKLFPHLILIEDK